MGWRTKLVSLLVVYFAGFATAVYCLAPGPEPGSRETLGTTRRHAALRSEEIARSVNSGLHKCIAFSKEAAWQAAAFLRERTDESRTRSGRTAPPPSGPKTRR